MKEPKLYLVEKEVLIRKTPVLDRNDGGEPILDESYAEIIEDNIVESRFVDEDGNTVE